MSKIVGPGVLFPFILEGPGHFFVVPFTHPTVWRRFKEPHQKPACLACCRKKREEEDDLGVTGATWSKQRKLVVFFFRFGKVLVLGEAPPNSLSQLVNCEATKAI